MKTFQMLIKFPNKLIYQLFQMFFIRTTEKVPNIEPNPIRLKSSPTIYSCSAFNNTRHPPELQQVCCCKSPVILCHVQVEFIEQKNYSVTQRSQVLEHSSYLFSISMLFDFQIHSFTGSFLFLLVLRALHKFRTTHCRLLKVNSHPQRHRFCFYLI